MDVGQTISLLIHCMNRTYDLKKSMPSIIEAVNESPPMEIFILNYGSKDDLDEYASELMKTKLEEGNVFTYWKVNKNVYNSPNARNIAHLNCKGDYGIQWACDSYPRRDCFKLIRQLIEKEHPVWMAEGYTGRAVVCQKEEFRRAGGYDERFSMYAPEDRDICMRLRRRGGKFVEFPAELLHDTPTPWRVKVENLGVNIERSEMVARMHAIYDENNRLRTLVANEGKVWGV